MANIEILVGSGVTHRSVEALPFLPGLVLHKTPDAPGSDLYSITHRVSGLAILTHVPEQHLAVTRRMLGDACWTSLPDDIFESREYYELIRVVLRVIRGRDVLLDTEDENRRRCEPGPNWGFFPAVTTPLIHVEERSGAKEVEVRYEELLQLLEEAGRQRRVPAMLIQVGDREDVALVPNHILPPRFLADQRVTLLDATIRGCVVITTGMADRAVRGCCTRVSFGSDRFTMLGYLPFLRFVKRGLS